jgi:ribonuclease BN (tRNA processing enzyme)
VRLVLLGVRGSTPAPGAEFVRYGGHTSCVAVLADGAEVPSLVLDAGTGLRLLPGLLDGRPYRGTVVLSHLHWDHVQGIPFCSSVDNPGARVDLLVPGPWEPVGNGVGDTPRQLLAGGMSPPNFPIGPEGLQGAWRFLPARPGVRRLDAPAAGEPAATVTAAPVAHKGGVTLGVRIELDGASAAYLPDHTVCDPSETDPAAEALIQGVDVLLHDGQFLRREVGLARAYGHSTIEDVLLLADRCGVGRLVLTHHAPQRTDDELDELAATFGRTPRGRPVAFARQGDVIDVRPAAATGVSAYARTAPSEAKGEQS